MHNEVDDNNTSIPQGGVVLVSAEHAESFLARYSREAEKCEAKLVPVKLGSLEQLKELVHLVSTKQVRRFGKRGGLEARRLTAQGTRAFGVY